MLGFAAVVQANLSCRDSEQWGPSPFARCGAFALASRYKFLIAGLLVLLLSVSCANAQSPAQTPPAAAASKPAAAAQQVPRVTTTVVVRGDVNDGYDALDQLSGNLDGALQPVKETPLSVSVTSRGLLNDMGARVLSDVVKNDASVGEDYAPVGYYGDFQIRGFPLDLGTAIQINGMAIAGEQDVPLENKEQVEFVKGIAGVESGVASAGGLVNYVTKPALKIEAVDMATDHRGTSYGAIDLGRFLGASKRSGIRINLAGENMHTYVEDANGWRGMGAADGTWQLNPATTLLADFEYQHKVERSVAGYQLLGGDTVPEDVFPSVMLGDQSWSLPNTFDAFNTGLRLTHAFNAHWSVHLAGSYSHLLIDDNVIWPYGPALDINGDSLCPNSPYYFFCPDGSYEIYDYRSPGELRTDALGEALLQGHFKTGPVSHDFVADGSLFHRSVDLSPSVVYFPLGIENIYSPNAAYEPDDQQADSAQLADSNRQAAAIVQDRAHLPHGVVLTAGGRFVRMGDFNYTTTRDLWLPEYGATYTPLKSLTFYANYGVLLSLGQQAPWFTANGSSFLDPFFTRQVEAGVKYAPSQRILITTAFFRMRAPFFYSEDLGSGADCFGNATTSDTPLCFLSQGRETHDGVELNAQGKAASWLQLSASAAAIQALASQTGTTPFDNKQVINVPHLHTTLFADILLPHARGLHLMPGWSYTGRKEATRDDAVSVPGYNLFNLGARYMPGGENGRLTLRLYADNIFDKRYWKDTGASYGDTFIHLGAPTTVRLSAHYTF